MPIFKYIGALILFAVPTIIGVSAGKKEREKLALCEAFLEFFEYIKNQVEYFLAPTKLIYRGFENKTLSDIGFLDALLKRENDDIYIDAWERAFSECSAGISMSEEQKSIVIAFGACVGKTNERLQINGFDYYIKAMKAATEKQRAENEKSVKLYRTIGITVGAMLAIIAL